MDMTDDASDVYILGAGFSRAISPRMPLLNELGEEVVSRLPEGTVPADVRLSPSNFELWLSYLAEDQPWHDEVQRLRNRAAFVAVARLVSGVVEERERETRSAEMPAWLRSLVARWHEDRAVVITFNYDDLVEAAYTEVVSVKTRPDDEHDYVSHAQLQRNPLSPIGTRAGAVWTASAVETFTLLKLHGSRSWLYSGQPSFYGETIYDTCRARGWAPDAPDPRPWLAEDKAPLIVPPTSGKTGFFDNETIRSEWRRAHLALRHAKRIFVVGYSAPPSDLLARFLLQHGCSSGAAFTVANPDEKVHVSVDHLLTEAGLSPVAQSLRDAQELAGTLPSADVAPVVLLHT